MSSRNPEIPHNIERIALHRLRGGREVAANMLHPAGRGTLIKMMAKGWIVRLENQAYQITANGEAALRIKIPTEKKTGLRGAKSHSRKDVDAEVSRSIDLD